MEPSSLFIHFKEVSNDNIHAIDDIQSLAYPSDMQVWNKELLSNKNVRERLMCRFSFLLYTGIYAGHCIAFVDQSFVEPESGYQTLFIADMAVRPEFQRRGYGLLMAQEILRRANQDDVHRIEFCARESTTLKAIQNSSHTNCLLEYGGFIKSELGRQPFSESNPNSEYGRLIVLQKTGEKNPDK